MATQQEGIDISMKASADLSSYQYCFLYASADDTVALATSPTHSIVGILQNKPAGTSRAAAVRVAGVSKLVAHAAATVGAYVTAGTTGRGSTTTTQGHVVGGQVLDGVDAAAEIVTVKVCTFTYQATA